MSTLNEVLNWASGLPSWQSDAVSRLLFKRRLSDQDIDDLYALLKAAHGIADPKGRGVKPLSADDIPIPTNADAVVKLQSIKTMVDVNAIAEGHPLKFAHSGLTVVYGDNGSGKSGFSRVLKRACRARDQAEPILPNANFPSSNERRPQATFEISENDILREVVWIDGAPSPPVLSTLAVFDSRCADLYLSQEDDFAYVPFGLSVFEEMAALFGRLKQLIEAEQKSFVVDPVQFEVLRGNTAVGTLIASLSAKTTEMSIDVLATVSEEERIEQGRLEILLRETNPRERAKQVRALSQRVAGLAGIVSNRSQVIADDAIAKLKLAAAESRIAEIAADLAAQKFRGDQDLLPGTTGEAWRALFDAAREFALMSHPGKSFANFDPTTRCPLCQEPLRAGAVRLAQFEAFVQQEAEMTVQIRRDEFQKLLNQFETATVTLGCDETTFAELGQVDLQLSNDIRAYETAIGVYHRMVVEAIAVNDWSALGPPPSSPSPRLYALCEALRTEAQSLEDSGDITTRNNMQQRNEELKARLRLSQLKEVVHAAVVKYRHDAKLSKCVSALKTTGISTKAAEMAEKIVSAELADALNREFTALGVQNLKMSLKSKAAKGKALHRLRLAFDPPRNPIEILSEGEQRAVAIGSFLAEVGLSGNPGGIILDDPVSSLDHRRREKLAERLVLEAAKRQVIVFTHDIYYLCLLVESAEGRGVPIWTQSINRTAKGFGVSNPGLPFEGTKTTARIAYLRDQHQKIEKLYKLGEEEECRRLTIEAYVKLRMGWERAIEEVLFRDVVVRFRKSIQTNRLKDVLVEVSDHVAISNGMTKCSNYAHDKAQGGGVAVPDPNELKADIDALAAWRTSVELRMKNMPKAGNAGAPVSGMV